jgi:hypothetical protein
LPLSKPALSAPQAFFRADEATTRTPIALATGLHVLVWYTIVWYTVNMVKKQTSIRMSDTAKELVVLLAARLGISQSAVLELAIRTLAKREGIQEKGVK